MVVLFMGRLSYHAQAHPLAMYQALERLRQQMGVAGRKRLPTLFDWHVVMCLNTKPCGMDPLFCFCQLPYAYSAC